MDQEKLSRMKESYLASARAKGRSDGAAVWQGYMDRWALTQAYEPGAEFQVDYMARYPGSQYLRVFNIAQELVGSPDRLVDYSALPEGSELRQEVDFVDALQAGHAPQFLSIVEPNSEQEKQPGMEPAGPL